MKFKSRILRVLLVAALVTGIVGSLVPVSRVSAITGGFVVTPTPATPGAASVYTFSIVSLGITDVGDVFDVTFPAGTVVAAGGDSTIGAVAAADAVALQVLSLTVGAIVPIAAGTVIPFSIGVLSVTANPAVLSTYTLTVTKTTVGGGTGTADTVTATSASYSIGAPPTVTLGSTRAGSTTTNTVVFAAALITDIPVGGNVVITFPAGTTVASTMAASSVTINGVASTAAPVVLSRAVTVFWGGVAAVPVGAVTVIFTSAAGISNPTTPSTTLTATWVSSGAGTTSTSTVYTVATFADRSPTSAKSGDSVTISGGGLTPGADVNVTAGSLSTSSPAGAVASDGTFRFTATMTSAGTGTVTVSDTASPVRTATTATLTLLASATTTSTDVHVGDTVSLTLANFAGATTATLTFAGTAGAAPSPALGLAIPVPPATQRAGVPANQLAGNTEIRVTDNLGNFAEASVNVLPRAVTFTPTTGITGVTLVTANGTGWAKSATLGTMTIGGVAVPGSGLISTDTGGNIIPFSFTLPAGLASGSNAVVTTIAVTVLTGAFTVTTTATTATVNPATGPRGTVFVTSTTGQTASLMVAIGRITLGGLALNTTTQTLDTTGSLTAFTGTVPATAAYGDNTVAVTDPTPVTASTTFTVVQPTVSLGTTSGFVGSSTVVNGTGWLANSLVTLTRNGAGVVTATTDGAGSFSIAVPIPSSLFTGATANVLIGATDTSGNTAVAQTFIVNPPVVSADKTEVSAGELLTVTANGFLPFTGLTTLVFGSVTIIPATPVITGADGSVTFSINTPGLVGVQTLSVNMGGTTRTVAVTVSTGPGAGQPQPPATVLGGLFTGGVVELFSFTATGGQTFTGFATNPGDPTQELAGNQLTSVGSGVGILTVNEDTTVVVGGATFNLTAGQPAFFPLSAGDTFALG